MKRTIITLALVTVSLGAFAQGKVALQNNASSLVTLAPTDGVFNKAPGGQLLKPLTPADVGQANTAVGNASQLASGHKLVVGLYAGTSSSSLALVAPKTGSPSTDLRGYLMDSSNGQLAGVVPTTQYVLPIAGGVAGYFQVKVWDQQYATYEAAAALYGTPTMAYFGQSQIFTMIPGTSISYPSIVTGGSTTFVQEPIFVGVPEPTVAAIAGLGLASMLIFRRKK